MISSIIARGRSLWRAVRRRSDVEAEMNEEFRLHVDLRAQDLVQFGLSPTEASRRARLEFGSAERHKDEARASRGLHRIDALRFSWLDFKLGLRLLVKHRGVTVVGSLAMAFAIWTGAIGFEFFTQMVRPKLPLAGGDRIAGIVMLDAAAGSDANPTLHDFIRWRDALESVEDLGAYRTLGLNSIVGDRPAEPVEVAEISASAFHVAQARPLLGRILVKEDEQPSAPSVVVIGYDIWQRRFDSDPGVIGNELRLGNVRHTVVGVMPEGFRFPLAHSFWVPFRMRALDYDRDERPAVRIFGRLAPGATLEKAQAELAVLGVDAAGNDSDTHQLLRPRILPYARSVYGAFYDDLALRVTSANLLVLMLLFLVCGNVALLMFARAATRENEITVRSALGATRGRITGQLFVEALVLGVIAGAVGLMAAQLTWRWVFEVIAMEMWDGRDVPFWFHSDLSPATVPYAALLTLLAAGVAGFLPGLKVTRGLATRLRQVGPGGGGFRFGGIWTVLIVAQVAVMATVPVFLFIIVGESGQIRSMDVGFPTEEYLSATLVVDQERVPSPDSAAQLMAPAAAYPELERRLEAEPGITAVTFADRLPLMSHPRRRIEVDRGAASAGEDFGSRIVRAAAVAPDFFDAVDAPILSGRGFHSGDLFPSARNVIVNQSFVRLILGGSNPIGRRLRYRPLEDLDGSTSTNEPWYEIVGVVRDMGMAFRAAASAGIYHPLVPGESWPVRVAVHTRGDPSGFVSRMRSIATDVDPTLQLHDIARLDEVNAENLRIYTVFFWIAIVMTAAVSLLSLTGIYTILSFAASQRMREVGIRVALGAKPRQVAAAIFRRPLAQVGLGIMAGLALAFDISGFSVKGAYIVGMYGCVIIAICALAAIKPVRSMLSIQPSEALRADP